jgi:hypothetical protein
MVQLLVHFVAVSFAYFEQQVTAEPIAAQTFHTEAFASVHQFFGEETCEVAYAAHDVAAEEFLGIAHGQLPINLALI